MTGRLALRHHGPDDTLTMRDLLVPIYSATHAPLIGVDPWNAPEKWWQRLTDTYSKTRDFDLVTGWDGDEVAGYAFGSPNDSARLWPSIHPVFPHLNAAGPVYIFREFAVRPDVQRRGYGMLIHDELLSGRPEQVAHLLLRKDNLPARAAYVSWGWKAAGEVKPFPDSQTFDAMALDLTSRR
ncbi:GNAT family N-acetyltransferase [Actinoplanes sp. NBRC 103695]|uniref:GNAT family N-acetyltransferase n=1 Tax=Actinoplanes sp. NBRC 103695 TaxID=3032202 RepID=UPI0025545689|nr:GNAT family N-acetyltransferase [Actinoplanes sp. NBRC 103695]